MIGRSLALLCWYVGMTVLFAVAYAFLPGAVAKVSGDFWEALYFSVVTATTLGYGEITPSNGLGKALVGAEAIGGVLSIGFFLMVLGQALADRIASAQNKANSFREDVANKERLVAYLPHTLQIITDFKDTFAFVVSSGDDRRTGYKIPFRSDFKMSDLRELYKPTGRAFAGYDDPVVFHYYRLLDQLVEDLRFVLANFRISIYGTFERDVSEFLRASYNPSIRQRITDDFHRTIGSEGVSIPSVVERDLASVEGKDLGTPEVHTFAPIQGLHRQLVEQAAVISSIEQAVHGIVNRVDV